MKKLVLILCLLLVPALAHAESINGALTASASSCTLATTNAVILRLGSADNTATIQLSGTFVGTVTFSVSTGGSSFTAAAAVPAAIGAAASTATSVGAWQLPVAGYTHVCVYASAYTSGTVQVAINSSTAPISALTQLTPQSLSATDSPQFVSLVLEGTTADAFETTISTEPTADRTITLPNATGIASVGNVVDIILCGDLPNNTTLYYSPATGFAAGLFYAFGGSYALAGAGCAAEDNATESTADEVLYTNNAVKILGMSCTVTGSGSNGVVINLRTAEGNLTPDVTITIPTSTTTGATVVGTTTDIAAGATFGMRVISTEDLSAQDIWCLAKALVVP